MDGIGKNVERQQNTQTNLRSPLDEFEVMAVPEYRRQDTEELARPMPHTNFTQSSYILWTSKKAAMGRGGEEERRAVRGNSREHQRPKTEQSPEDLHIHGDTTQYYLKTKKSNETKSTQEQCAAAMLNLPRF